MRALILFLLLFLTIPIIYAGSPAVVFLRSDGVDGGREDPPDGFGTIHGRVTDPSGAVIARALVRVFGGKDRSVRTYADSAGRFHFDGLPAGFYRVIVNSRGFSRFRSEPVWAGAGRTVEFQVQLQLAPAQDEIIVTPAGASGRPISHLGTIVLSGEDLLALPEATGGLAATMRLLAPRSGRARSADVRVDGFHQRRLPPKHAIREIRINENPFSAEYAEPGMSRIEILTQPGSDRLRGSIYFTFNNQSLNSRNPFAANRAAYESRLFSGNAGGPLIPGRASFFIDAERREVDDNAVINATVLDGNLNPQALNLAVVTPEVRTAVNPRMDFQFGSNHTLTARYLANRTNIRNAGIGGFSLPSRAHRSFDSEDSIQLTETGVFGAGVVNETRVQLSRLETRMEGDNEEPSIHVPEAFRGGGSQTGLLLDRADRWEVQNHTFWRWGNHLLKGGIQVLGTSLSNRSSFNFGGTYTFAGGLAPVLDRHGAIAVGPDGKPTLAPITTIESYRRTLLFLQQGLTPSQVRALGGGAARFSISEGERDMGVRQHEIGVFLQDDWNLRSNLSMSLGLRIERQDNIGRPLVLAPRFGLAWAPDAASGSPKTVLRAGFGVFYDRFSPSYTLRALRFNGINQREYIVSDAEILDLFPETPSLEQIAAFQVPPTIVQVDGDLRAPHTMQSTVSVDRELPANLSLGISYAHSRTIYALRSRNLNTPISRDPFVRPMPELGEVFQYESSGRFEQDQLIFNLTQRFGTKLTGYVTYIVSNSRSDTEGAESFPADSFDLSNEFGPTLLDARHSFYWGAWIEAPGGWRLTPLYVYRSGLPFNLVTGIDSNGDSLFLERPSLATDPSRPSVVITPLGAFDLAPEPGQAIIPRNWGRGPGFSSLGLSISRTFNLGPQSPEAGASWRRGLQLILSAQIENAFNRVNPGRPVGNLSSPLFGQSTSSAGAWGLGANAAGNRQIVFRLHLRF